MKIYKITKASAYLGVSINTLKTLANNGKINSFKTSGGHRRFRQDDLDSYMGVEKEKQEKLTVIYSKYNNALQEIKSLKGLKTWIIWSSDPNRRRHVEAKTQKEIGDYTVFSIGKEEVFKIKTSLIETIERR